MKGRGFWVCLPAVLILLSPPAEAQRRTGRVAPTMDNGPMRAVTLHGFVRSEHTTIGLSMIRVELGTFGGGPVETTFTNPEGAFTFYNVPPATYQVSVNQDGYEPVQETVEVNGEMDVMGLVLFLKELPGHAPGPPGDIVSAQELALPHKVKKDFEKAMETLYEKHKPEASLALFDRVIEQAPDFYPAYHHSGIADLQLARFSEAESILRKALALNPPRPGETQTALASALVSLDKCAEAEPLARQGLAAYPASWLANIVLARALVGLNHYDEAEKPAREALQLNAKLPQAYLLLATIHIKRNDTASLVSDLDNFLRLEPKGPQSDAVRKTLEQARKDLALAKAPAAPAPRP